MGWGLKGDRRGFTQRRRDAKGWRAVEGVECRVFPLSGTGGGQGKPLLAVGGWQSGGLCEGFNHGVHRGTEENGEGRLRAGLRLGGEKGVRKWEGMVEG